MVMFMCMVKDYEIYVGTKMSSCTIKHNILVNKNVENVVVVNY